MSVQSSTHLKREGENSPKSGKLSAALIREALIIGKFAFCSGRRNSNV